jgi:hypothetical protein
MNSSILWSDQVPQRDGVKSSINDIAISPGRFSADNKVVVFAWIEIGDDPVLRPVDGSKVICAVGNRVLLYDAETGDLIESLKGLILILELLMLIECWYSFLIVNFISSC